MLRSALNPCEMSFRKIFFQNGLHVLWRNAVKVDCIFDGYLQKQGSESVRTLRAYALELFGCGYQTPMHCVLRTAIHVKTAVRIELLD